MKRFFTILLICFGICVNTTIGYAFDLKRKQLTVAEPNPKSEQATVMYVQNNIDSALEILKEIPDEERTAQDWLMMGNILQDLDKINEALVMYNQATLKDPKYYKAYYNIGYIYLSQDRPNIALVNFQKAVKYKPDFSYGYYNIGCAYLKLKEYKKAKSNFFRALSLKANEPDTYYNLAYTYKMLNNEKQAKVYMDLYNKMMEQHDL